MASRLTDRSIASLKATDASSYHFDSEVNGLAVRVYASGRKVFVFDWREGGKQRRITIGKFPVWSVGKARAHAGKLRLKADVGESVVVERGGRIVDLVEQWMEVVKLTRRASTADGYRGMVDGYIIPAFGKDDPKSLTRNRIELWHGKLAQRVPTRANRCLAVLSSFLTWLEHDHKIERNPCKGVAKGTESPRQLFLSAEQIATTHAVLSASNKRSEALALRLTLLTGCRIGEALALEASQIDAERALWSKPAATTKQKKLHVIPLQGEALKVALALLAVGVPTYEDVRRLWERTKVTIGRPECRVHDLRHSRASSLARVGASLIEIGAVLGHSKAQTTQRYTHLIHSDLARLVERAS